MTSFLFTDLENEVSDNGVEAFNPGLAYTVGFSWERSVSPLPNPFVWIVYNPTQRGELQGVSLFVVHSLHKQPGYYDGIKLKMTAGAIGKVNAVAFQLIECVLFAL